MVDSSQNRVPDVLDPNCPSRHIMEIIGNKWSIYIIMHLSKRPLRNSELLDKIQNVSQKVLTQALRRLEAQDIVIRTVYPEVPSKVEYKLSETGLSLLPIIHMLGQWAEDHYARQLKMQRDNTA